MRPSKRSDRKQVIILLTIAVIALFVVLASQTAFNNTILEAETNQQAIVFYALSLLISLLFVALTFVLARNLLKLFAERRMGVVGSKFRTRMVAGALLLSFVPVIVMYWFAYGLMNRSIDKWFSTPVEEVRSDTQAMVPCCRGTRSRIRLPKRLLLRALRRPSAHLTAMASRRLPMNFSSMRSRYRADLRSRCTTGT